MAEENGHTTERRRHISAEDKGRILAEVLLGGKSVSAAGGRVQGSPEPDIRLAQGAVRDRGGRVRPQASRHCREGAGTENRRAGEGAGREGRRHRGNRAGEPFPQKKLNGRTLAKGS